MKHFGPFLYDGNLSYLEFSSDALFRVYANVVSVDHSKGTDPSNEWYSMLVFQADPQSQALTLFDEVTAFGYQEVQSWPINQRETYDLDLSSEMIAPLIMEKLKEIGNVETPDSKLTSIYEARLKRIHSVAKDTPDIK